MFNTQRMTSHVHFSPWTRLLLCLRMCPVVIRPSIKVSLFSFCRATSMSFPPKSFFPILTALHSVECHIGEHGLTQWVPLDLFSHQAKHVQQLDHRFHNRFDHRSCKGDFGINLEAVQEFFDQLEQFSERVVAGTNVLCRLAFLDYTRIQKWEVKKGTYTE